ncbi:glycoside hydrolase superfamily [Cladochytrium replicatum]|nr:glycoside hydrolase superfamily [Cladochytrium replicatum]
MASTRRLVCGFFFWTKVFFSICLSLGILAFFSWRIYYLHLAAIAPKIDFGGGASNANGGSSGSGPSGSGSSATPERCYYKCSSADCLARLEPPGKIFFGFHLDWQIDTPLNMTNKLNKQYTPGIWNAFVQLDPAAANPLNRDLINWHAQQVELVNGGVLELTIEPLTADPSTIRASIYSDIADLCRNINEKYGVPILLRWGHEMNGPWTQYGLRPTGYKAGFQALARAVRARTNATAMLWSPNVGITYPFNNNENVPAATTADFRALDTNGDGVLNGLDDPYTPYYPGDEYVDWVGISLYWYPDVSRTNPVNIAPTATFFRDYLTATGPSLNGQVTASTFNAANHNFYQMFGVDRNKPIILSESGAPYFIDAAPGPGEVSLKKNWWEQVLSTSTLSTFPKVKGYVNFEEAKVEDSFNKSWALTFSPDVRAALLADLPNIAPLTIQGTRLKFDCAGTVTVTNSLKKRGEL